MEKISFVAAVFRSTNTFWRHIYNTNVAMWFSLNEQVVTRPLRETKFSSISLLAFQNQLSKLSKTWIRDNKTWSILIFLKITYTSRKKGVSEMRLATKAGWSNTEIRTKKIAEFKRNLSLRVHFNYFSLF